MLKSGNTTKNHQKNRELNPVTSAFIKTQFFAVISTVILFSVFSLIAYMFDLPRKYDSLASVVLFSAIALSIGYFAGMKIRSKGLIIGALFTLPYITFVTLLSVTINDFSADITTLLSVVSMLFSAAFGGILAVNKRLK